MITSYHANYFAYELSKRHAFNSMGKLAGTLTNVQAKVDLNPHQVEAALFAFKSPLSNGAILADEVGLGKTIEKVETIRLAGKVVYSIADGALLICLEEMIENDLIQAVADAEPAQFICLDKAFGGNDQLKANAMQTFKAFNEDREVKVEFRTV